MSRGINKFIGIGVVGKDAEIRYLPAGGAVASISIAVNESWKDKDGQKQERTEWLRIVFFNRLAEIVGEYVRKGSKIYVEGQIRTRSYEKDGQQVYVTEIVASEMQLLDSRQGGPAAAQTNDAPPRPINHNAQRPAQQNGTQSRQPQPAPQQPAGYDNYDNFDDDIPF